SVAAIGDLNHDGRPDLAVLSTYTFVDSFVVSIHLGNGDGTFGGRTDFRTSDGSNSVAIGDVDQDGWLDLAVANSNANAVSVLLGKGDGTFAPKMDYGTGPYPHSVHLVDVNSDQRLDMVVTNQLASSVSVLLNRGITPVAVENLEAVALDGRVRLSW